ncbi:YigZ family protein [Enterococcus massiliensis]|uniref:YigZ family protein n=1 Tax=Enterococcus massiliensis TaxID=1640685 RepID=UPI00065E16D2|nr:YigZ family protein [Enterococcus massiliensis]
MLATYLTIKEDGQAETEIKKSRFICSLKRVQTEEEAKEFIQAIKKEHWKANHNCSAFLLGEKNEIQRSSDDGEPSGTAGIPMLEVLKKNNLINVAAVVTRYFGGTKLGAGGLIRAYSHAVSNGLEKIGIVQGKLQQEVLVTIPYPLVGKLQHFLETQKISVKDTIFATDVTMTCMIDEEQQTLFIQQVNDLLNGKGQFDKGAVSYVEEPI